MKKRFLMIGISPAHGGTESVIYSMLPYWHERGLTFDFINTYDCPLCGEDRLIKMGCRIFSLNLRRRGRLLAYRKSVRGFFLRHKGEYDGVWLNMQEPEQATILIQARKCGISQRLVVAHFAGFRARSSFFRAILLRMERIRVNRAASTRIAVSSLAAEYAFRGNAYYVINSGVNCKRFGFDERRRKTTRNELSVAADAPLFMCAGRLTQSKNYPFLLRVYHEIAKRRPEAQFLIVGQGEMEQDLRSDAEQLALAGLRFITDCNDISPYLDAADAFVFPSLYEGLGMVLIEAQCSGLSCFASDHVIPKEAAVLSNFAWIGLEQGPEKWAEKILACSILGTRQRKEGAEKIMAAGLTNEEVAQKYLWHIYEK